MTPDDFRAAFTAAEGWGAFSQKRKGKTQQEMIELRWGRLSLKSLAFEVPENFKPAQVTLTTAGKSAECDYTLNDRRVEINLKDALVLTPGQMLVVTIQR